MINIQAGDSNVNWQHAADIFQAVGWGSRAPQDICAAFAQSTFKCFAFDEGKLIGFARTVDDGKYYATVVDVVVHPDYQGRGIGRRIMETLQDRVTGFLMVTLTAAPRVRAFYQRLGWQKQSTAMMLPRSQQQARDNCD